MALERDDDDPIGVALREIERLHGVNVGLRAERDRLRADVAELVEVLAAVVARFTEVQPAIANAEKIAWLHGWRYAGPTMEQPLSEADIVLARVRGEKEPTA